MTTPHTTADRNGATVTEGCYVRIVQLLPSTLAVLEPENVPEVSTMVGEILRVDEVDNHGLAWVSKTFREEGDEIFGHMFGLAAEEMELSRPPNETDG